MMGVGGESNGPPFLNGSAILITMIPAFFLERQCHGFSCLYTSLLCMSPIMLPELISRQHYC